ncbi:MAG: hypothetical protein R2867_20585 [Caldilineaceae bacterium]
MGRIIRRTVTITIAETWTIVWTDNIQADERPLPPATTIVQDQRKTKEEPDETILPAITSGAATDTQPADMSPKSGTGRKPKRTRRSAG